MGVKYQDYPKGWVNGRYVGEKMFSKDGTRTPTVTQDAIGEMGEAKDANGLSINSDDGYDNIREMDRMGTITPDVLAYDTIDPPLENGVMQPGTVLSDPNHDKPVETSDSDSESGEDESGEDESA